MKLRIVTLPGSDLGKALKTSGDFFQSSRDNFILEEEGVSGHARMFASSEELEVPVKDLPSCMGKIALEYPELRNIITVMIFLHAISNKRHRNQQTVYHEKDAIAHIEKPWRVHELGNPNGSWELSVIHISNAHAHVSYGWFDHTKLMIWGTGGHCHYVPVPGTADGYRKIAQDLCDRMNRDHNTLKVEK